MYRLTGRVRPPGPLDPATLFPQTQQTPQKPPLQEPPMRVGVPREIKPDEYRVGLPPTAVPNTMAA